MMSTGSRKSHSRPEAESDHLIWRALCDPSRRRILDLLRSHAMMTGDLCRCFETSRFAVMKHLNVLEAAGLIVVERRGRTRINYLNPAPIQAIYRRWIKPFDRLPADRLLRLKATVEANEE